MSQHFIDDIKIENFKCFENLEITGFKRVNLFGGKNNVGKTALLEAIELLLSSITPISFLIKTLNLLKRRQENLDEIELDIIKRNSEFLVLNSSLKKARMMISRPFITGSIDNLDDAIILSINDKELTVKVGDITSIAKGTKKLSERINFVNSSKINNGELSDLYGALADLNKENFLNNSLKNFDQSIEAFKIITFNGKSIPKLKIDGLEKLVPLSEMGDGISRYITILCAIWASQNGFLFIDEIENGIHYSNYKKLWELIFMASEQANCQVFVTSHSKECIDAFNQVQLERSDNTGMYFELYHSERKKRIVAAGRDAEQLHYSLTHGVAIRGE